MRQHPSTYLRKRKKFESRLIKVMIGLLFMSVAFIAGFIIRGDAALLTYLGFDTGASDDETASLVAASSASTFNSLSARIAEVEDILSESSVDTYDLDSTTINMLSVFTVSTNDPFVAYLDKEHYEAYLSASADTYRGIGVLFSENQGEAYAVDVFAGSQAEAEGVKPGDFIVAISGDKGTDGKWTQAEVLKAIENAGDSTLYVTWRRPASLDAEGGEEYSVELDVSDMEEPNVEVQLTDDGVGYIKLSQITSNSADLMGKAIDNLEDQGAQAYVLDLRDNPGGYLSQSIDIGSLFVKNGKFVEIITNDSTLIREVGGKTATDKPLVVIVNGKTGAAAEVLAGGLRDNDRCVLIGETTQGKGTIQSVSALSFGGGLRYTSAYYKTPKGYDIESVGIAPDAQVSSDDSNKDTQKDYALEMAASMIEN